MIASVIDPKKITAWGESGFPARFLGLDDEEYLDVLVVYDGRREDLQAQVLNSLYERIGDDLRVIGIDSNPSISYRDKTEDSEWSDLVRVSPFGQ